MGFGLSIEAYALTDVGLQRDHNEDALDIIADRGFYVVADGMGGHASGQVASRIAVDSFRRYVAELASRSDHEFTFPCKDGAGPPERLLSNAIQYSNERVFIESLKERRYEGMGTTIVCAHAFEQFLVLGHVGDSRVYRYRDREVVQLTRDHSLLNHYIEQGRITTDEEIRNFKEGNIIVKALGLKDYVEPDVDVVDKKEGDIFLLCTDGLSDQVDDWILANVLHGNYDDLRTACASLVRLANEAGGKDNCTVMLLKVHGEGSDYAERAPAVPTETTPLRTDDSTEPSMPAVRDEDFHETDTVEEFPVYSGDEETDPGLDFDDSEYNFEDRMDDPAKG